MPASVTSSRRTSDTPATSYTTTQQGFSSSQQNLAGLGSQFSNGTPRSAAQTEEAIRQDIKKLTLANGGVRTMVGARGTLTRK